MIDPMPGFMRCTPETKQVFMPWNYKTPLEDFFGHMKNQQKGGSFPRLKIDAAMKKKTSWKEPRITGGRITAGRMAVVHSAFWANIYNQKKRIEEKIERLANAEKNNERVGERTVRTLLRRLQKERASSPFATYPVHPVTPTDWEKAVDARAKADEALSVSCALMIRDLNQSIEADRLCQIENVNFGKHSHNTCYWDHAFISNLTRFCRTFGAGAPNHAVLLPIVEAALDDLQIVRSKHQDEIGSRIRTALRKTKEDPYWDSPWLFLTIAPYGISARVAPPTDTQMDIPETVIFLKDNDC